MNNRVLVGGLIGAVVSFLLGYLVWEVALGTMMEENTLAGLFRPMEEFNWAFLILGNLFLGLLIAYILDKANANSFGSGATVAAIVGFLLWASFDFTMYGVSNYYSTMTGVFVDIIASTVVWGIIGGVIGGYYGRGRKTVVA